MKQYRIPLVCFAIFLTFAGLRILHWETSTAIREFPDTKGYVTKATWPLKTTVKFGVVPEDAQRSIAKDWIELRVSFRKSAGLPAWLLQGRSPTVPLLYKLAGNTNRSITNFQLILSMACWGLLAVFVARTVEINALKPVAFFIILLFSLSDPIIIWDSFLLSDSISLSLMALFIASWFWLLEGWRWPKVLLMLCVAALWAFARDSNAWMILLLAGLLLGWQRAAGRYILVAAVFVMLFAVHEISQNYSNRWVMPFVNVLGRRILPDTEAKNYFAQSGMPSTAAVMRLSGLLAWHKDRLFYQDPDLSELREWVHTDGKPTYVGYLLAHPVTALISPFRNPKEIVASDLSYYRYAAFSPILKTVFARAIYVEQYPRLLTFGPLIISLVLLFMRIRGIGYTGAKHHHLLLISLALILLFYPHAAIAWHGDANDIGRHALLASVHLRLALWFLFIFSLDRLFLSDNSSKLQSLKSTADKAVISQSL